MFSKFKPFEGPEKFSWQDPDTNRMFHAPSKRELVDRILAYRRQNNLEEIEHLPAVLENYWCGLAENFGKCEPVKLERGFLAYKQGAMTLLKNMVYQSFVPQIVADKRAEQCSMCKYNVFPDKEGFVAWSDKIAEASTLGKRAAKHEDLGNCDVCTCPLRSKVFMGGSIPLEKEWLPKMREVNCWQLKVGKIIDK